MALVPSVTRTVRSSKNFFRQIKFLVCFFYDFDVKYRRKYTGDEKHDEETKERNCFRSCDILPRTTFNFVLIRNLLFTGVVRKNNMR